MPLKSKFLLQSHSPAGQVLDHELQRFGFPGGERHVRLPESVRACRHSVFTVTAMLYTADGVLDLMLLADALGRSRPAVGFLKLVLPYVPYARQDRVALPGEPLSAAVFCRLVNGLGFDQVVIVDPHSDVVPALLAKVDVRPQSEFLAPVLKNLQAAGPVTLVAPDAGARRRVEAVGLAFSLPVIHATKKRDPATGRLSGAAMEGAIPDTALVVVDDICDGGGTFIELARELRNRTSAPLHLVVTHGLFTKGLDELFKYFDSVNAVFWADPDLHDEATRRSRIQPMPDAA